MFRQRPLTMRTHPHDGPRGLAWAARLAGGVVAFAAFCAVSFWLMERFAPPPPPPVATLQVRDDYTDAPVPGARVTLVPLACATEGQCVPKEMVGGGAVAWTYDADAAGQVRTRLLGDRATVYVQRQGYEARRDEFTWPPPANLTLALRPMWVDGRVTYLGKPLADAKVRAQVGNGEPVATATTDADGRYRLNDLPAGASLIVDAPNVSRRARLVARRTTVDMALRPDILAGKVRDTAGQPVVGLTVAAGKLVAQTGADGAFTLAGVDDGETVIVKGVGYLPQEFRVGADLAPTITMRPFVVKGLYVQAPVAAKPAELDKLIALVNGSDLNAMVIDLKDNNGLVYYDSKVPLAREVGAVQPLFDAPQLVKTLHERGIYAIGRITVMEDPVAAIKRPDLAIKDVRTGKPWRNNNGQPWLNPANPAVWKYIADLGAEAASLGFDEIQFDYVRFPTDGNLDVADFGPGFKPGPEARREAIRGFLTLAKERLTPTKALVGADVFGVIAWLKGDNGIGQQFEDLAALVDVICPMDYPSHFGRGFNNWDIPNNYPYEVIRESIAKRAVRVPEVGRKTRPWLQAFTYGPGRAYGTAEVFAQIQACNEGGTSGYLLWNAANDYPAAWLPPRSPASTPYTVAPG